MKKIFKILMKIIITILLVVTFYFLLSYLLMFFPKRVVNQEIKDRTIYVLYNEMHTDIVFNINEINRSKLPEFKNKKRGYLAFGWGDKETYLNTPTWNDLKLSTALKALFLNTPSLMHVSYYGEIHRYSNLKTIKLSRGQFKHLEESILKSFSTKREIFRGYGTEDFFYSSKESYNYINTCNTWTGNQLREANVSMSYWTPLSQNVTASLP